MMEDDEFLELTGCNDPDETYKFLKEVLTLAKKYEFKSIRDLIYLRDHEGMEAFIYYVLARVGLLEYPGEYAGNITDFGEEFLMQLEELCPGEE